MPGKGVQIGLRYSKLLVIGIEDDKVYKRQESSGIQYRRLKRYRVRCDCGNEIVVFGQDLSGGKTKSCHMGLCARKFDDDSIPAFNQLYQHVYKGRAHKDGKVFELTRDQFKQLVDSSCYYCGIEPASVAKVKSGTYMSQYRYNGIDRVDNSKGYILDNCVTACSLCNHAKHTMSHDDFIDLCRRVVLKHGA